MMKAFWKRIKSDVFVWLVFYFIFTLPLTMYWLEYIASIEPSISSAALDHVGGSPAWYPYYYWYLGHRQSCFLFSTIAWSIYKVIILLRNKYKRS